MIARASGLGMWVGRFSRQLREVRVLAMPDAGLDTTRRFEFVCKVTSGASVLQLVVPRVVVGVFIHCRSVVDGLETYALRDICNAGINQRR